MGIGWTRAGSVDTARESIVADYFYSLDMLITGERPYARHPLNMDEMHIPRLIADEDNQ